MKRFWKNLSIILRICSLVLIFSCQREQQERFQALNSEVPDEEADSVFVVSTTGNVVEFELQADKMFKYYDTKLTIADTVFVTFFYEDGSIKSTLYCDKAKLDDFENTLTGIGNVVIESENGKMKAPFIKVNRNNNQVKAEKGVTLLRGTNTLYGAEMESDLNLNKAKIIKVSAEGTIKDEEIEW